MATAKRRSKKSPRPVTTALRLQPPTEALAALIRERSRLLKVITKKQGELEQAREHERIIALTLFERMQPLVKQHDTLQKELRTLFDELLAEGRLSRTARKKVAEVYRFLNDNGDLESFTPRASDDLKDGPDFDPFDDCAPRSSPRPSDTVSSAKHAGGQLGHETLRGLFRRLAVTLHPDLVQDEHEQKRRTDVMKEVTRAYEEGDLARLIEIEQGVLAGKNMRSDASAEELKCAELERAIMELKRQQKAIATEITAIRSNNPLTEIFGARRVTQAEQAEQLDAVIAMATEELEPLRKIRDFVRSFSERKITLAEFLRGPTALRTDEFDLADAMLEYALSDMGFDFAPPQTPKGSKKGRNVKPRRAQFDDIPF
jgi:hypothetical protein